MVEACRKIERIMELGRREKNYGRLPKLIHKGYLYNVSPYLHHGARAIKQKLLAYPLGAADKESKLSLPSPVKPSHLVPTADLLVMKKLPIKVPHHVLNPKPAIAKSNQSVSKATKPIDNDHDTSY